MRKRWHVTATAIAVVIGLLGLPGVPVPAQLLGVAPIQVSVTAEIDPVLQQVLATRTSLSRRS